MVVKSNLTIHGVEIELVRKRIKHLHIRVYPPNGEVRVSSPLFMSVEEVRGAIVNRLPWILDQRIRMQAMPQPTGPRFASGEVHYAWGVPLELELVEGVLRSSVSREDEHLLLHVPFDSDLEQRRDLLNSWYRRQMRDALPGLVAKWEYALEVQVAEWRIRRMRTLWGSCNIPARRIWLSLELAKKPEECLDYVVAHEVTHLVERNHGPAFDAILDSVLPQWRATDQLLNPGALRSRGLK